MDCELLIKTGLVFPSHEPRKASFSC